MTKAIDPFTPQRDEESQLIRACLVSLHKELPQWIGKTPKDELILRIKNDIIAQHNAIAAKKASRRLSAERARKLAAHATACRKSRMRTREREARRAS